MKMEMMSWFVKESWASLAGVSASAGGVVRLGVMDGGVDRFRLAGGCEARAGRSATGGVDRFRTAGGSEAKSATGGVDRFRMAGGCEAKPAPGGVDRFRTAGGCEELVEVLRDPFLHDCKILFAATRKHSLKRSSWHLAPSVLAVVSSRTDLRTSPYSSRARSPFRRRSYAREVGF